MSEEFETYTPEAPPILKDKSKTSAKYPITKIISMVLAVISGVLFIYYAAGYTTDYFAQIGQYKQMGMEIPKTTLYVIYFQLAITYLMGVLPLVGAALPNKFTKCALLLIAAPICWGMTNTFPSIIMSFIQKAAFKDIVDILVMFLGGFFALAAAILLVVTPTYCEAEEDEEEEEILTYIPEDITDEDYTETAENIEADEAAPVEETEEASDNISAEETKAPEDNIEE